MSNRVVSCPDCQAEKPHYAKGLCRPCYKKSGRGWRLCVCVDCAQEKRHFAKGRCAACHGKAYAAAHPERILTNRRRWHFKDRYGLTLDQVQALADAQGGACAICARALGDLKTSRVDHCHKTGVVRGMLCGRCNVGLGHFQDDPEALRRAICYLEKTAHPT